MTLDSRPMVVKMVESILNRVRDQHLNEQSERTFADDRQSDIYRLLVESGGRIRQQEVGARTELTSSKISNQLSAMEENGDIVRVKVGREKIVCLPEMVPNEQL